MSNSDAQEILKFLLFHRQYLSSHVNMGFNSPEILMRGEYSVKSDVYSFGVIMLELLTGRKPFDRYSIITSINLFTPQPPSNKGSLGHLLWLFHYLFLNNSKTVQGLDPNNHWYNGHRHNSMTSMLSQKW